MEELTKIIMEANMNNLFQEEFESRIELKNKPKRIRKIRPGICEYCNKSFADKRHLYAHVRIHTGEKPFICNVCQKGFNQSSNLRRHLVVHTERKFFNCDVCERQFMDEFHFKDHVRAHTGVKPYTCPICNKSYAYRNSLICHKLCHDPTYVKKRKVRHKKGTEIKCFCQICKEGFAAKNLLRYHMRVHNTERKTYPCTLCKRVFSRSTRFHSHLLSIHNIKIAFQCKKCNERFPDKRTLGKHLPCHKKDKMSIAPQQNETNGIELNKDIEKNTVNKDHLSDIFKSIKIALQCEKCSKCFLDVKALEKHYLCHEKNEESIAPHKKEININASYKHIKCDLGGKMPFSEKFSSSQREVEITTELEQDFKKDMTQNEDPCELSTVSQELLSEPEHDFENDIRRNKNNSEWDRGSQENLGIKTEPEQYIKNTIIKNRYVCGICNKEFSYITSIQEHLQTHTPQYIFVCHKCRKCFNSKSLLEQHVCSSDTDIKFLECYICEEKFSNRDVLKEHLCNHTEEDTYI